MKILTTSAALAWFHIFHPEVVGERPNDVNRLLKGNFDFEAQTIEADNLDRCQRCICGHQNALPSCWVLDHHKTNQTASRPP